MLDAPKSCVVPKVGVPLVAPLDAPKPGVAPPKAEVVAAGAADAPKLLLVAPKAGALIVEPKPPLPNVAGAVPAAKPPPLLAPKGAGANPAHGKYVTPLVPPAPNVAPRAYAKSRFSALVAASARRDRLRASRPWRGHRRQ